ncbi:MAG TPA: Cu2+-exporting ATPase, partial [Erysipelotrichaceae bacterium]|nr:Cu2+-exporting ATPase [Erysipelotrichaceae bacterium]
DGINDAPALMRADTGIAIGAGTDVAIDSADIVLMNSKLSDVAAAIRLSRATLKNIHENLFWAFFYNIICIPMAAGLYGFRMNPMLGAAAMSLSSFTVCMNALRLNLFRLHDASHDRKLKHPALAEEAEPEETAVCHVGGMMCEHCEATVEKAVSKIEGVTAAKADHTKGTLEITMNRPVDMSLVKAAVESKDYTWNEEGEEKKMEKTVRIEGMMCEHCEASVKKALEKIDGIESATASHTAGTAVITLSKDVDEALIKEAIEDRDYKYLGME